MRWKGWEKVPLEVPDPAVPGKTRGVAAIAPVIISASRATDIPAFYGDWFMDRLAAGYVRWRSPFGGNDIFVSFEKTRVFAFWSKNPEPFLRHLPELDRRGYGYYFLFTLNDYEREGLEPGVPPPGDRIATFKRLSLALGKGRVVWRFDPLVLSEGIGVPDLLEKIRSIGDHIALFTERMVFSFVNIDKYAKVRRNLDAAGINGAREFSSGERDEFCAGLAELNRSWGLTITSCAERYDLSRYGISPGQCISGDLLCREFASDPALMRFLEPEGQQAIAAGFTAGNPWRHLKDPGQRTTCRCIVSKDIGQYATCPHGCVYCYANSTQDLAMRNYARHREEWECGGRRDTITGSQ